MKNNSNRFYIRSTLRFTSTRERVRTKRPRWALICWKCFVPYFEHTDLNLPFFRCKPFANLSIKPVKVKVTIFFKQDQNLIMKCCIFLFQDPRTFKSITLYKSALHQLCPFELFFCTQLQSPARQKYLTETSMFLFHHLKILLRYLTEISMVFFRQLNIFSCIC